MADPGWEDKDLGLRMQELIARVDPLLAEVDGQNGGSVPAWQSPDVSAGLESLLDLLALDALAEESSEQRYLSRLTKARTRLRKRLEKSAEEASDLLDHPSRDSFSNLSRDLNEQLARESTAGLERLAAEAGVWGARLERAREVWQGLAQALADESPWVRDLERQAAARWRDASVVNGFWGHLRRCLIFSIGSLVFGYLLYALAFAHRAASASSLGLALDFRTRLGVVVDTLAWTMTDPTSLVLSALVLFAASLLLYRLGIVALVKVQTRQLADSVGALREFLQIPPGPGTQGFPSVPTVSKSSQVTRRGRRIKWPVLLPAIGRLKGALTAAFLYLSCLLLIPAGLGLSRKEVTVLRAEAGTCQPASGLLLSENRERVVLLMLGSSPSTASGPRHATLVVPRREISAMGRGLDLGCKPSARPAATTIVWRALAETGEAPTEVPVPDLVPLEEALKAVAAELGGIREGDEESVRRLEVKLDAVFSKLEQQRVVDLSATTIERLKPDPAPVVKALGSIADQLEHQTIPAIQLAQTVADQLCLAKAEAARHAVKNLVGSGRTKYLRLLQGSCPDLDLGPFINGSQPAKETVVTADASGAR